jgi:hypothetical protein
MEAKSEPAGSQSNDVPQIQRLLLQQKEVTTPDFKHPNGSKW